MPGNLSGPTLIVILFIVLLLFGAPKLPALARSLGQSMKILKKEVGGEDKATTNEKPSDEATAPADVPVPPKVDAEAELARARQEAEAARAEAEELRRQAEARAPQVSNPEAPEVK